MFWLRSASKFVGLVGGLGVLWLGGFGSVSCIVLSRGLGERKGRDSENVVEARPASGVVSSVRKFTSTEDENLPQSTPKK